MMRMLKKRTHTLLLATLALVTVPLSLVQAEISVRTEVSPRSGTTNDVFTFSVIVSDTRASTPPRLAGTDDFDVDYIGPNSFVSIVNGDITARTTFVYRLAPKREGDLATPAVSITINGKDFSADPIPITIGKGETRQQVSGKPGSVPVFIRQTATPSTAFEGQQIVNIVDLYTAVDLAELQPIDLVADGFWQETITEGDRSRRVVDGKDYESVQFVKALYPLSSGKLYLPPRVLKAKAAIPSPAANQPIDPFDPFNSGGLFDSFFQRVQYQSISLKSNEIKLDVQPLPPAPADIQALLGPVPIVGSTSVSVDSDVSISKVGESKTLTFHVVSEGNINPLTTLPLVVPEGVKSYEERPETKRERKGAKLLLHRYFRFSIVPLKPGLIKIPPARVAFFSPSTGRYEVASSKEIAFAVQGQPIDSSAATGSASASTASSGAIPTMPPLPFGPDLEYEAATLVERVTELFSLKSALLALSSVIGLLGIIALFLKLRPSPPPEGLSSADLAQVASLDSLERFIRNLLARRLKGLKPESSLDEIRARIAAEIQNPESALTLRTILDELEVLRYGGPQGTAPSQLDALKDRLNPLLRALTSGR